MGFFDTDHDWVLARDHREIVDALLERIDPDNDDHLPRLTAACLERGEKDIRWAEVDIPSSD